MEAAGIEPASAAAPGRASTGLAHPSLSPGRPVCERPTAGPAILWSHPSGDWLSFGASPFMTPLPPPRAERGATRCLTQLGSECEFVIRTYVGSRLFYEADRGPRPAAQPENRPRRDLVAPVCSLQPQCSLAPRGIESARSCSGARTTRPMADAQVRRIWVAPTHGRKGLGRALLEPSRTRRSSTATRKARSETGNEAPDALGLYTSNGSAPTPSRARSRRTPRADASNQL
jgi:GNAT superfamily N-acetyltransferase